MNLRSHPVCRHGRSTISRGHTPGDPVMAQQEKRGGSGGSAAQGGTHLGRLESMGQLRRGGTCVGFAGWVGVGRRTSLAWGLVVEDRAGTGWKVCKGGKLKAVWSLTCRRWGAGRGVGVGSRSPSNVIETVPLDQGIPETGQAPSGWESPSGRGRCVADGCICVQEWPYTKGHATGVSQGHKGSRSRSRSEVVSQRCPKGRGRTTAQSRVQAPTWGQGSVTCGNWRVCRTP